MIEEPAAEPELSPDFQVRVLALADRHLAARRRLRWIAGASISSIAVVATMSWIAFGRSPPSDSPREAVAMSAPSPSYATEPRAETPGALAYFFPDAEPLARFDAEDRGEDAADAGTLFEDQ